MTCGDLPNLRNRSRFRGHDLSSHAMICRQIPLRSLWVRYEKVSCIPRSLFRVSDEILRGCSSSRFCSSRMARHDQEQKPGLRKSSFHIDIYTEFVALSRDYFSTRSTGCSLDISSEDKCISSFSSKRCTLRMKP